MAAADQELHPEPGPGQGSLAGTAHHFGRLAAAAPSEALGIELLASGPGGTATAWIPIPPTASADIVREYVTARLANLLTVSSPRSLELRCSPALSATVEQAVQTLQDSPDSYGQILDLAARMHGQPVALTVTAASRPRACPGGPAAETAVEPCRRSAVQSPADILRQIPGMVIGVDVGGTDVKLAVGDAVGIHLLLEHVWSPKPKALTSGAEFTAAIGGLIRFAAAAFAVGRAPDRADLREEMHRLAADPHAALAEKKRWTDNAAAAGLQLPAPDAIGLSFPDVIAGTEIVGGMTSKYAGIRGKYQDGAGAWRDQPGYWAEFQREVRPLGALLAAGVAAWAGREPAVAVINDGTAGSLWAAVETNRPNVLSLSLGTSVAGGKVDGQCRPSPGMFEVANAIALTGPDPQRRFRHRTLALSGCIQQLLSQDALFRLAEAAGVIAGYPAGREAETVARLVNELPQTNPAASGQIAQGLAIYLCHALSAIQAASLQDTADAVVLFGRVIRGEFGRDVIGRAQRLAAARPEFAGLRTVELFRASDIPCRTPVRAAGNLDALAQAIGAVFLAAQAAAVSRPARRAARGG